MCVINININGSTQAGTIITSASGRYRKLGQTTWNNFTIPNINAAKTPNITELGQYELEVNITNNIGSTSDWASSSFQITTDCGVEAPTIECGNIQEFSSSSGKGVYYADIELGTNTGTVSLDYFSGGIPDRFELIYNGSVVADTKLVGNHLSIQSNGLPDARLSKWKPNSGSQMFVGTTYTNVPNKRWNGTTYVDDGTSQTITVTQNMVGPANNYLGSGVISFNKTSAFPTKVTVRVTSLPDNTGWDFTPSCPQLTSTTTDPQVGATSRFGVVNSGGCTFSPRSGINTLVDWEDGGDNIGDRYFLAGTLTPFNGSEQVYVQTLDGGNQSYADISVLNISPSEYAVRIDSDGYVIQVFDCN